MEEMENTLRNSKLYLLKLSADDDDLSGKLGLKVEYVTNMADDNEAELIPIDDSNYYGLIRLRKELKNINLRIFMRLFIIYLMLGMATKWMSVFSEKRKEKPTVTKSRELII
ncbi:MAG: hypothetical protein ACLR0U_10475 [Enterocloster clostridioformis]